MVGSRGVGVWGLGGSCPGVVRSRVGGVWGSKGSGGQGVVGV